MMEAGGPSAVLPAALFGLGGALNEYKLSESWLQASIMSLFKLVIHPAIAYALMVWVLHVPLEYARYAVLLAAMPAGINVYVFATYYDRAVNVATNVVLISTVASMVTITGWLWRALRDAYAPEVFSNETHASRSGGAFGTGAGMGVPWAGSAA
eukprot:gene57375-78609_t